MSVIICSARQNENGGISGGQPGDQTGHEIERQDWYLWEPGGWIIARAKSPEAAEAIASNMEAIADNEYIGYDQPTNQSLYSVSKKYGFDASKVTTPCNTDCARAVRVCIYYAGIDVVDFYTGNEIAALRDTSAFEIIDEPKSYTNSPDYLRRGDILCSRQKGHTVVVLTDGPKSRQDAAKRYRQYVEATAAINLRQAPRLTGIVSGYLGMGCRKEFTGCIATDERGVKWYEVYESPLRSSGLWASSVYSKILEV